MGEKKNNQINRATVIYISSMILFATVAFLSAFAYKYYLHYKWIKARGEVVRCRNQEIERQILWQYGLEEGDTIWTNTVNDEWFLVLEGEKVDDLADLNREVDSSGNRSDRFNSIKSFKKITEPVYLWRKSDKFGTYNGAGRVETFGIYGSADKISGTIT